MLKIKKPPGMLVAGQQGQTGQVRFMQSMSGLLVGSISRYLVMSLSAASSLSKPQLDFPLRSNADLFVGCTASTCEE